MAKQIIIGVTGTFGAGKGTVVDYLVEQKGFKRVGVSDGFLSSEAIRRGIEPDRIARQNIANELRAQGPTKLMEATFELAKSIVQSGEPIIVDPQHTVAEVQFIQDKGGVVIAVDAPIDVRYERIKKRNSPKDQVTFEEFKAVEDLEMASDDPNKNNLAAATAHADFVIQNNGSLEDLHAQIDEVLKKIGIA